MVVWLRPALRVSFNLVTVIAVGTEKRVSHFDYCGFTCIWCSCMHKLHQQPSATVCLWQEGIYPGVHLDSGQHACCIILHIGFAVHQVKQRILADVVTCLHEQMLSCHSARCII